MITPYVPIFLLGVAFSLVPAAMWPAVTKIVGENKIGTAYGAMFSVQNLGLWAFPMLIGAVLERSNPGVAELKAAGENAVYDYTNPLLMLAFLGVLGLIFAFLLKRADKEQGYGLDEALIEAGKTRLRPIIMTALTTILALIAMAVGYGQGAEMMQPMAVTTIGGLLYATLLTLFVVPIMYQLVTLHGKYIFGFGLAIVVAIAAAAGFYFLESLPILIGGGVLFLVIIVLLFIPFRKKVQSVE